MKRRPDRLWIQDRFHSGAKALRGHAEEVLGNPRGADPRRFCWDFWHVPGQYRLLRTPAYHFFPKKLYDPFHARLVQWGRSVLGCHDVSPPWLSAYVEGCEQHFHADLPHGPWSFVFSLSRPGSFKGGETLLLRDEVLSFWEQESLGDEAGLEQQQVLEAIPPEFNRLVVFDPRIPHGVRRVEGALDPLAGRMVVHGWFVNPRPFIQGPLSERELGGAIDRILEGLGGWLQDSPWAGVRVRGMASFSFSVGTDGRVRGLKLLAHSLRTTVSADGLVEALLAWLSGRLGQARFAKGRAGRAGARTSRVTLPFVFE